MGVSGLAYGEREQFPLTGIRLWRWRVALLLYRLGCRVSGRAYHLLVWDDAWKVWYCPHCGWADDHDDDEWHGRAR